VAMAIGTNPAGGILSGTTPKVTTAGGVATFADLSIDKAGTGYTLRTTVGSVVQDSAPFDLAVPPPLPRLVARPTNTFSGAETNLSFPFSRGTGAIDNGVGTVTSGTPKVVTGIIATTTFHLTVTNPAGTTASASATATLTSPAGWVDLNNTAGLDTRAAQPFSLTFDPANSSTIYAATLASGVVKTTAGGQPW